MPILETVRHHLKPPRQPSGGSRQGAERGRKGRQPSSSTGGAWWGIGRRQCGPPARSARVRAGTQTRLRCLQGRPTIDTDERCPDHRLFRGLVAVDADDDPMLARTVDAAGNVVEEEPEEPDFAWLSRHSWAWNPARLDELIAAAAPATLYVCGGADNELELADRFTQVFLLGQRHRWG